MNRSPGLAGVLSVLFPGLGHLYAGARSSALALAAVFLAGIQSVDYSGRELLVLPLLGIWLFGILDAIRVTEEAVRARAEGRQPDLGMDRRWAVGLVLVGAAATLTLIPGLGWAVRLWPLALVWIGVQLLRGKPVLPGFLNPSPDGGGGGGPSGQPAAAGDPVPPVPPAPPAAAADKTPAAPTEAGDAPLAPNGNDERK